MIALESVQVELGGRPVVDGVSAAVAAGEWVTLIGPNGAGKSTLLRAVAQLVSFRGGIRLDGRDAAAVGRRDLARRIAFVPQSPLLPPEMSVREYVLLGHGRVRQHPRIFAPASLRGIHDQRTLLESHAGKSAGHHKDFLPIKNLGRKSTWRPSK